MTHSTLQSNEFNIIAMFHVCHLIDKMSEGGDHSPNQSITGCLCRSRLFQSSCLGAGLSTLFLVISYRWMIKATTIVIRVCNAGPLLLEVNHWIEIASKVLGTGLITNWIRMICQKVVSCCQGINPISTKKKKKISPTILTVAIFKHNDHSKGESFYSLAFTIMKGDPTLDRFSWGVSKLVMPSQR